MEQFDSRISFEKCRTGDVTCSFQGKYLHSKYNPKNEGERFALTINADFSPLCVFILEPALSYCAPFIKKRFPGAEICAIRFKKDFSESDGLWNRVFYLENTQKLPLSELLFASLGEEKLISSLAFDWIPTKNAFPSESENAWLEIKKAILKARDVIGTRAYFSKRWLKNSVIFASSLEKAMTLKKGSSPVIITASGPSLKSSIPFIKKFRSSFFLIAVSSSLMPLAKNEVEPDLLISCDGGFWAKKHLVFPSQKKFPVYALETEGAAPKKLLKNHRILTLTYPDSIGKNLLDATKIPYMLSERNGTAAGTALAFAAKITSGNIYLSGFDQESALGFQHTQPNALEIENFSKDTRLRSTEKRTIFSRFGSDASLAIYRNWFITNSAFFAKRVSRISDKFTYNHSLGQISEKNWQDFERLEVMHEKNPAIFPKIESGEIGTESQKRNEIILKKLTELSKSQEFANEVFPMDFLLIKREISEEKKLELQKKLSEKTEELISECRRLLRGNYLP